MKRFGKSIGCIVLTQDSERQALTGAENVAGSVWSARLQRNLQCRGTTCRAPTPREQPATAVINPAQAGPHYLFHVRVS